MELPERLQFGRFGIMLEMLHFNKLQGGSDGVVHAFEKDHPGPWWISELQLPVIKT
jgi:hypothetical protein